MSFADLGLSPAILEAVIAQGYTTPSPIQAAAIPAVLEGKDIMAAAQTGTGKTAGFTLPILEMLSKGPRVQSNQVRALVLTPTRELAAQVADNVDKYSKNTHLTSCVIFGGVKANPQMMRMRKGADVLVATPGRLLDLVNQGAIKFSQLEFLVLDEADRMLDMGFIHDIKKILKVLPKKRQNLLFSATFSNDIRALAKGLVNNPVEISVAPPNVTTKLVKQWIYPVDKKQKHAALAKLIEDGNWKQALVFSRTKHGANKLTKFLEDRGIRAAAIHGNKSQGARTRALADFKAGTVRILVATDIAARGIDIEQLPQVVNFDLPNVPEDYVHRIGRTGRAGSEGHAVSLVCADETKELFAIERVIGELLEREVLAGFEPVSRLPESRLNSRPVRANKPKRKPHSEHHDGQHAANSTKQHKQGGNNSGNNAGNNSARRSHKPAAKKSSSGNSDSPWANSNGQRHKPNQSR
jgi:ATP-dependent RNA helicase RhlE